LAGGINKINCFWGSKGNRLAWERRSGSHLI